MGAGQRNDGRDLGGTAGYAVYSFSSTWSTSNSSALLTVLWKTFMNRVTQRIDGVSTYIHGHSRNCLGVRVSVRPGLLSATLTHSSPALIRSLVDSTR